MTASCISCAHYQGEHRPVGLCALRSFLVVAVFDGLRCSAFEGAARSAAPFPPATNRGGKVSRDEAGDAESSLKNNPFGRT